MYDRFILEIISPPLQIHRILIENLCYTETYGIQIFMIENSWGSDRSLLVDILILTSLKIYTII